MHSYNLNMTTNGTVQLLEVLLRYKWSDLGITNAHPGAVCV